MKQGLVSYVPHLECTCRDSAYWFHCRPRYSNHRLVRRTRQLVSRHSRRNTRLPWNHTPGSSGNKSDHRSADQVCTRRCGDHADQGHRNYQNSSCYLPDRSRLPRDISPQSQRRRSATQGARQRHRPQSVATACAGLVALRAPLPNRRTDYRPHHSPSSHARVRACCSHGDS